MGTFEEAELDRDRPIQERWYRRFNKWSNKNQRQAQKQVKKEERQAQKQVKKEERQARRSCRVPACHGPPPGPPGPPRGWNQHPRFFGPPPEKCGPPPEQVDHALKEAIRRSMLDYKTRKKDNESTEREDVAVKDARKEEESKSEPVEEAPAVDKTPTIEDEEAPAVPSAEREVEEEFEIPPEAPVGAHPAPSVKEPEEKDIEVVVHVSEPCTSFTNVDVSEPCQVFSKQPPTPASPEKTTSEESFACDAEGNGEVAEALGETMDAIASAIEDISAELETVGDVKEDKQEEEADDKVVVDAASESKAGATILSGEEEADEKSEDDKSEDGSQGSWDVVGDEALARAAQVIGSALFDSQVSGSQQASNEEVSMLGSDHSLPTTLPSVGSVNEVTPDADNSSVNPVQLDRWVTQLRLHELGFNDDVLNVETLERLQAANIGSGETDEVSVEKVVNELMKMVERLRIR